MAPLDHSSERKFKVIGQRPLRPDGIEKVTGRAQYGADLYVTNMLHSKILRSTHPHAKIKSIDISAAENLSGVKAVITSADFKKIQPDGPKDVLENCIAHDRVLYDGHAVAAVAAISNSIAKKALKSVSYTHLRAHET